MSIQSLFSSVCWQLCIGSHWILGFTCPWWVISPKWELSSARHGIFCPAWLVYLASLCFNYCVYTSRAAQKAGNAKKCGRNGAGTMSISTPYEPGIVPTSSVKGVQAARHETEKENVSGARRVWGTMKLTTPVTISSKEAYNRWKPSVYQTQT